MDNHSPEQRHRNMSAIHSRDTKAEIALRKTLYHKGYRYRKNFKGLPGKPDIVMTRYRLAIFCDSEFFHGKDWDTLPDKLLKSNNSDFWIKKISDNIERDGNVNRTLRAMGWHVIRFWNRDILKNPDECLRTIEEAVSEERMDSEEIWFTDQ